MQIRERVCDDFAFVARIRVFDEILDSQKYCSFSLGNSKAKFYRIVLNERVGVKRVPFSFESGALEKYQEPKNMTIRFILYWVRI